jgi:hypothetical protein
MSTSQSWTSMIFWPSSLGAGGAEDPQAKVATANPAKSA